MCVSHYFCTSFVAPRTKFYVCFSVILSHGLSLINLFRMYNNYILVLHTHIEIKYNYILEALTVNCMMYTF